LTSDVVSTGDDLFMSDVVLTGDYLIISDIVLSGDVVLTGGVEILMTTTLSAAPPVHPDGGRVRRKRDVAENPYSDYDMDITFVPQVSIFATVLINKTM